MALGVIDAAIISVPPIAALVSNQPAKVWSALVGTGSGPIGSPGVLVHVAGVTVPPLAFQVIAIVFTVHLA